MDEDIVINVEFNGGDLPVPNAGNVQVVPANLAWEDFELMLKVFSDQEVIEVQYIDDESDIVTICSQEELSEAFKVAKLCNNTLNLKVNCGDRVQGNNKPKEVPPTAAAASDAAVDASEAVRRSVEKEEKPKAEAPPAPQTLAALASQAESAAAAAMKQEDSILFRELQKGLKSPAKEPAKEPHREWFFIQNEASGKVLDIADESDASEMSDEEEAWHKHSGAKVIMWKQKNDQHGLSAVRNQLWYEKDNTIHSQYNDMCLTMEELDETHSAKTRLTVRPYEEGNASQEWELKEKKLRNVQQPARVMGQQGDSVTAELDQDQPQQKWKKSIFFTHPVPRLTRKFQMAAKIKPLNVYSQTAKELSSASSTTAPTRTEAPKSNATVQKGNTVVSEQKAPQWFVKEMDKVKQEMTSEVSARVAQLTVKQVLQGLEGAVVSSMSVPSTATPTPQPSRTHSMDSRVRYSHDSIICDHCDCTIVGVRYKCGNCEDYDLCEACEGVEGVHDETHVFLALRRPVLSAGRRSDGRLSPLLRHNIYRAAEQNSKASKPEKPASQGSSEESSSPTSGHDYRESKMIERLKRKEEKLKRQEEKLKKKEEKIEERRKRTEEKLKRRLDGEERPSKKERLDLPQFKLSMRMDSLFVEDLSFPDGSHVQPGTKIVKKWLVANTGTHAWDSNTTLKMVWGNMAPVESQVNVPHLKVKEQGTVAAEILVPNEPGSYQSHWRMVHSGVRFGHRIWCAVVVDPAEILEVPTPQAAVVEQTAVKAIADQNDDGEPEVEKIIVEAKESSEPQEKIKVVVQGQTDEDYGEVVEEVVAAASPPSEQSPTEEAEVKEEECGEVLTAQDILSFEMLNIGGDASRQQQAPGLSQTATPNNTPLESRDVTPPKSPVPVEMEMVDEEEEADSSSSSVVVVGETPNSEESYHQFTQYVQDKMAMLAFGPEADDVMSLSGVSDMSSGDDSDSSDRDYYIVPIPDCFNPSLPASKSASTSIYVLKEDINKTSKTVDEMLTASSSVATPTLQPSNAAPQSRDADSQASPATCSMDSQATVSTAVAENQATVSTATAENQASVSMVAANSQASVSMVSMDSQASPATNTIHSQTPIKALSTVDVVSQTANWIKDHSSEDPLFEFIKADTADAATATTRVTTADSQTSPTTVIVYSDGISQTAYRIIDKDCQTDTKTMATAATGVDEEEEIEKRSVDSQTRIVRTSDVGQQMGDDEEEQKEEEETEEEGWQDGEDDDEEEEEEHRFEDAQGALTEEEEETEAQVPLDAARSSSCPPENDREPQDQQRTSSSTGSSSNIMSAALGVATQAAASAFSTAKDVFHTLQYAPPQSTWTPTQNQWSPPAQPQWNPQETAATAEDNWTPPQEAGSTEMTPTPPRPQEESEEMAQLLEMGFANRQRNRELLHKHANDLEAVIQELISADNDWHATRH